MATITLKNVPDDLYAKLKESAALHRRSINSEAILCLESSLRVRRRSPEEVLARVRRLRKSLGDIYLTDEDIDRAKREGRP